MENINLVDEEEFQKKYGALVAAIKESDVHSNIEERKWNMLLLSLVDEVLEEHKRNQN